MRLSIILGFLGLWLGGHATRFFLALQSSILSVLGRRLPATDYRSLGFGCEVLVSTGWYEACRYRKARVPILKYSIFDRQYSIINIQSPMLNTGLVSAEDHTGFMDIPQSRLCQIM